MTLDATPPDAHLARLAVPQSTQPSQPGSAIERLMSVARNMSRGLNATSPDVFPLSAAQIALTKGLQGMDLQGVAPQVLVLMHQLETRGGIKRLVFKDLRVLDQGSAILDISLEDEPVSLSVVVHEGVMKISRITE